MQLAASAQAPDYYQLHYPNEGFFFLHREQDKHHHALAPNDMHHKVVPERHDLLLNNRKQVIHDRKTIGTLLASLAPDGCV